MLGLYPQSFNAVPRADGRTEIRQDPAGRTIRITHLLGPVLVPGAARILVERFWPPYPLRQVRVTMWLKELGPGLALSEWLDGYPAFRPEFSSLYRLELEANRTTLDSLRTLMRRCPITLLYVTGDAQHTHATILADYILQDRIGTHAHIPS
ncbi:MAG: DUF488 domain-containing protein [Sphingomonadales bacterium]